jgi:cytochrome P450
MGRSESCWENPEIFSPERFLDSNKRHPAFMPFLVGPRTCLGQKMAREKFVKKLIFRHIPK